MADDQKTLAQLVRDKYPGAYDQLSDADLEAKVTAKYPGVYDQVPKTQAKPTGFVQDKPIDALKGFNETANPLMSVKALAEMAQRHGGDPFQVLGEMAWNAIKASGHEFSTAGQKAAAAWRAPLGSTEQTNAMSEAVGHGLAGVVPVVGPAAAQAGEKIARGEVYGGAGEGAGLIAQTLLGGKLSSPETADALTETAGRKIAKGITPTTGGSVKIRLGNIAKDVGPRLATEPGLNAATTAGAAEKIGTRLDQAAGGLDAAADARLKGRPLDTKPMLNDLQAQRDELTSQPLEGHLPQRTAVERTSPIVDERGQPITVTDLKAQPIGQEVVPGPNAARVAVIDKAMSEIKALGPVADYDELAKIRRAYDGPAKVKYAPAVTPDFLEKRQAAAGAADVTFSLRKRLAEFDPQSAAANAEYSFWKNADDVTRAAEEADFARPRTFRTVMARTLGGLVGAHYEGVGGAIAGMVTGPVVDAAIGSVNGRYVVGRALGSLAKAIRSGDVAAMQQSAAVLRGITMKQDASRIALKAAAST